MASDAGEVQEDIGGEKGRISALEFLLMTIEPP